MIPIAGKTKEVEGEWRVEVYSTDGRASMPFPVGAVFPNDNRLSDAEIERQINQFGRGDDARLDARDSDRLRISKTMKVTDIEIIRKEAHSRLRANSFTSG